MTSTPAASALRQKVVGGLGWKLVSQIIAQGSRTIVGIVLAHLLTPEQFGLAAMALVFTSLAWIFTELSLGSALIQRPVITEADRSTVFWTTLATGAVMTLVGVALAPVAGAFFSMPSVTPLFAVASLLTFLSALGGTQMALLSREMNFRSLEIREIASTLFGTAVGITMALSGFGAWTIIGQTLLQLQRRRSSSGVSPPGVRNGSIRARACARFGSFGVKTLLSKILGYII